MSQRSLQSVAGRFGTASMATSALFALALVFTLIGCSHGPDRKTSHPLYGGGAPSDEADYDEAADMAYEVAAGESAAPSEAAWAEPGRIRPSYPVATDGTAAPAAAGSSGRGGDGMEMGPVPPGWAEPSAEPVPIEQYQMVPELTAATVSDAERRDNYLAFLARHPHERNRVALDMTRRTRIRVTDGQGRPVHGASIQVHSQLGRVDGRTFADGRWDFHPGVSQPALEGEALLVVRHRGVEARSRIEVPRWGDGQDVEIRLPHASASLPTSLDLEFLIDVTGSMEDELRYVNREVSDIVMRVRQAVPEVDVRVGAVFYRDRGDRAPLQGIPLTADTQQFARAMQLIRAEGGGDYPEDMNAGLEAALRRLPFQDGSSARILVVIADAPPQRYADANFTYREAMMLAAQRGIRIVPVAASGASREVEMLFRAMGSFTGAPYVYLTDDSGIGNSHLEADTDRVAVEYFADVLTRLVISELKGRGMHEPGPFGPGGQL